MKILDRFSSSALAAPSISMSFDLITDDKIEGFNNEVPGTVIICKDMYSLDLGDNIIWYNGKILWNYLPAEKEVTITEPSDDDFSFQSRPSEIFSMYKEGFKVRLIDEDTDRYVIDLYPEDLESEYIRIRLSLGKTFPDLKSVEYKNKNGLTITIKVREFDLKKVPDKSSFTFDPEKFRDTEVIDLR